MRSLLPPQIAQLAAGDGPRVLLPLAACVALAIWLLAGAPAIEVTLPGGGLVLALDGLSGFYLLLVLLERAAGPPERRGRLAGAVLMLLAGDGITLLAGVALMGGPRRTQALPALLLLGALALLGGGSFEAMRLAEAASDTGLMALVTGAALLLGGQAAPYLVLRLLLDVANPMPGWAGGAVILAGAGMALAAAAAASRARHLPRLLAAISRSLAGFAVGGAGLTLAGTLNDVAAPAAAGLAVTFLAGIMAAGVLPMWRIVAATSGRAAMSANGGVLRMLPVGGLAAVIAALTLALVPPGAGFMLLWQGFAGLQALPDGPLLAAIATVSLAVTAALLAQAALRLLATGLRGGEAPPVTEGRWARIRFAVFGLLAVLAGLFPAVIFALGAPAAILLAGPVHPAGAAGYVPWQVAALIALMAALAALLLRRHGVEGHRGILAPSAPMATPAAPAALLPRRLRAALRRIVGLRRRLPHRPTARPAGAAIGLALLLLVLGLIGQALP